MSITLVNETYIAFIPNVKSLQKLTDFRPISLYNVFYNIIAKVRANRSKKVLPLNILFIQSIFIPNRLILDNILATYKTLHTMQLVK